MANPTENVVIFDGDFARRQRTATEYLESLGHHDLELWVFSADPDRWQAATPLVRPHIPIDITDARRILEHAHSRLRGRPFAVVLDGLMTSEGRPLARVLRSKGVTVVSLTSSRQVRGDHRYTRVWTAGAQWRLRGVHKGFCSIERPAASAAPAPPAGATWGAWLWSFRPLGFA